MSFTIVVQHRAKKSITILPRDVRVRIKKKIIQCLSEYPFPKGGCDIRKVEGTDYLRLRVGQYRVFYYLDVGSNIVHIDSIVHRSKAYREF